MAWIGMSFLSWNLPHKFQNRIEKCRQCRTWQRCCSTHISRKYFVTIVLDKVLNVQLFSSEGGLWKRSLLKDSNFLKKRHFQEKTFVLTSENLHPYFRSTVWFQIYHFQLLSAVSFELLQLYRASQFMLIIPNEPTR